MKTVTIQIGNTDDKLTQKEWSDFVRLVHEAVLLQCKEIHFFGGSSNWEKWQNIAIVFELCEKSDVEELKRRLTHLRSKFSQDSVAWTEGVTRFI